MTRYVQSEKVRLRASMFGFLCIGLPSSEFHTSIGIPYLGAFKTRYVDKSGGERDLPNVVYLSTKGDGGKNPQNVVIVNVVYESPLL